MNRFKSPVYLLVALCVLLPALVMAQTYDSRSLAPAGKLGGEDGAAYHNFGHAVDIDGQTAVIGAPGWDNDGNTRRGAAYVFTQDNGAWTERARLLAEDGARFDGFGSAVAIDGDTLAVGAFRKDRPAPNFTTDAGAVVVYTGAGDTWDEQVTLMPDDLITDNFFGMSVALDGDTLIVGAPTYIAPQNQSAYVFVRSGDTWTQQGKLTPPGSGDGSSRTPRMAAGRPMEKASCSPAQAMGSS